MEIANINWVEKGNSRSYLLQTHKYSRSYLFLYKISEIKVSTISNYFDDSVADFQPDYELNSTVSWFTIEKY